MDVQTVFYALASIFMILGIVLLIALLVLVWKAYQGIQNTQKTIVEMKENMTERVSEFVSQKPSQIANIVGMNLSSFLIKKVKRAFNSRRSSGDDE